MKRILYASMQLPWPLDNGQKFVTVNDLTYLSQHCAIDLVSFIDPINLSRQDELLAELRKRLPDVNILSPVAHTILHGSLVRHKLPALVHGQLRRIPFVVSKYRNKEYLARIAQLMQAHAYDVLYIESVNSSFILDELPRECLDRVKVIYRAFDVFAETLTLYARELGLSPAGIAVRADLLACRSYERRLWQRVDSIFTVTRRLGNLMADAVPAIRDKIVYFPVFVEPARIRAAPERAGPRLLYVGTVHYPPNLLGLKWFLNECWPLVHQRFPEARFDVVGRGGEALLPVPDGVTIHRYVDSLDPYYQQAAVFVVPLFSGSGIRLKILDALSHGVPVVSTRAGYVGLEVTEGQELLVADDAPGFAAHVCRLLSNPSERGQFALRGLAFIEANHHPALARKAIADVLRSLDDA
ncbi:MAG: glycosyltransferase [Chloroflexaceae bacterium]